MMVTLVLTQNQRIENTQNHSRTFKNTKNTQPRIKLTFLYDSELEIQHIIYQNDEEKTYYNMESSKQSHKIIYEKSSFEII